jgi:hypothetical protein
MSFIIAENPTVYLESCLTLVNKVLADYQSPAEVSEAVDELNAYPRLTSLSSPQSLRVLEPLESVMELGLRSILEGRILWENASAGEATRLGLGPKFFLSPALLAGAIGQSAIWKHLKPISLGLRHMFQLVFEINKLAEESGVDPRKVLARQIFFLIGAEDTITAMSQKMVKALSGLIPIKNIWLMAQTSFRGFNRQPGCDWSFDLDSPLRLHNHGHMAIQKTMDKQIYYLDDSGRSNYFSRAEFFSRLEEYNDLISCNIEDLDFLTKAVDLAALGLATRLCHSGYGMLMEITGNNLRNPVKGGMCTYDSILGRDVVIESFRLNNVLPRDIKYLNKNINHYLNPSKVMAELADKGLFMPIVVHDDRVYFQPVQGDINFLVKTAYFTHSQEKELNPLKNLSDISAALVAMEAQDKQPGFANLAEPALGL